MSMEVTTPNNPQGLGVREAGAAIAARLTSEPAKSDSAPEVESEEESTPEDEVSASPSSDSESEEEPGEETPEASGEESAPAEFESLDQLLEAAFGDTSSEALKKLKVKVKIDGKQEETTLEDVLSGYSRTGDYTQKQQKLAQDRKELYEAHKSVHADYGRSMQQAVDAVRSQAKQYAEYLDSPAMQKLKETNAAQYILARDEIQQKLASFSQLEAKSKQDWDQRIDQHKQLTAEYTYGLVKEKRPDFGRKEAERAMKELGGYYSQEELSELADLRPALLAVELAEAREKIAALEARAKKGQDSIRSVKPTGTLKPGGAKTPRTEAQKAQFSRLQAVNKVRETGSVKDAGAALSLRLFGAQKGK